MAKLSRRRFLAGSAALAAMAGYPPHGKAVTPPIDLAVVRRGIEVKGKPASILGIEGPSGYRGIRLNAGQRFQARVVNRLSEPTLLHWHGQTPPSTQDGVPMMSQDLIAPGASYDYDFADLRAGTHWMHSHVGLQEQRMLAAPFIVTTPEEARADEQEHVIMLHDFTFRDPDEILAELQAGKGLHMDADMHDMDHMATGSMSMPGHLTDVAFDAFLANDRTLADPEVLRVEKNGRLRLRIINGAAASNMWIDLGALAAELIAVDGNPIAAVSGSLFPLAVAQRADIRVQLPAGDGAWPILFRPEGLKAQTGIVLATASGQVAKLSDEAPTAAPAVDLALEALLHPRDAIPAQPATRTEMVMLMGGGADYLWSLNGRSSHHDAIFTVQPGDRVEIMMHNMTSMSHPMHLHGHHFQVVAIDNRRINGARRDTVLAPPNKAVTIAFDADNPGAWAFHCHHLYHMNAGMMAAISYRSAA